MRSIVYSAGYPRCKAKQCGAFTLIELLIVVAIIAILAAIAVPNFLEAQVRAKVSRVRNDLRTLATALEAYHVDNNCYPVDDYHYAWVGSTLYNTGALALTTPVAYLTSLAPDPFDTCMVPPGWTGIVNAGQQPSGRSNVGYCLDTNNLGNGQRRPLLLPWIWALYGNAEVPWQLISIGPYCKWPTSLPEAQGGLNGDNTSCVYDPTNGTVSLGMIWRIPQGSR